MLTFHPRNVRSSSVLVYCAFIIYVFVIREHKLIVDIYFGLEALT